MRDSRHASASELQLGNGASSWKQAALCLGEQLVANGPEGYYDFTPARWLEWALQALAASSAPDRAVPQPTEPYVEVRSVEGSYICAGLTETEAAFVFNAAVEAYRLALREVKGLPREASAVPTPDLPSLLERAEAVAAHIDREQEKIQAACISGACWAPTIRELANTLRAPLPSTAGETK